MNAIGISFPTLCRSKNDTSEYWTSTSKHLYNNQATEKVLEKIFGRVVKKVMEQKSENMH